MTLEQHYANDPEVLAELKRLKELASQPTDPKRHQLCSDKRKSFAYSNWDVANAAYQLAGFAALAAFDEIHEKLHAEGGSLHK